MPSNVGNGEGMSASSNAATRKPKVEDGLTSVMPV